MLKRLAISFILFTMVLHSASRLGVLSYLYQQRLEIAYALGMIAEVPIAMCNSDYDFSPGLHIEAADEQESTIPPVLLTAQEIQLFCDGMPHVELTPDRLAITVEKQSPCRERAYVPPAQTIFHPPC